MNCLLGTRLCQCRTASSDDGYGARAFETVFASNASSQSGPWSVNPGVRVAGGLIATTNGASKSSPSDSSAGNSSITDTTSASATPATQGGRRGRGGSMERGRIALGVQLTRRAGPTDERIVVNAMAVDSATGEVWSVIGGNLVHLDKNGNLLGQYCLPTVDDMPLKPVTMLIEPNRILIGSDPFGIFEYPRPDKPLPASSPAR